MPIAPPTKHLDKFLISKILSCTLTVHLHPLVITIRSTSHIFGELSLKHLLSFLTCQEFKTPYTTTSKCGYKALAESRWSFLRLTDKFESCLFKCLVQSPNLLALTSLLYVNNSNFILNFEWSLATIFMLGRCLRTWNDGIHC